MFLEAMYYGIKYVMCMKHASDITNTNCLGKFCMCEAEQRNLLSNICYSLCEQHERELTQSSNAREHDLHRNQE